MVNEHSTPDRSRSERVFPLLANYRTWNVMDSGEKLLILPAPLPSYVLWTGVASLGLVWTILLGFVLFGDPIGAGALRIMPVIMVLLMPFVAGGLLGILSVVHRQEVQRGNYLELDRTTGTVHLPRRNVSFPVSAVHSVALQFSYPTPSEHERRIHARCALELVMEQDGRIERHPVVGSLVDSQLHETARTLAGELGVPISVECPLSKGELRLPPHLSAVFVYGILLGMGTVLVISSAVVGWMEPAGGDSRVLAVMLCVMGCGFVGMGWHCRKILLKSWHPALSRQGTGKSPNQIA